jgi:hypothetical protein
VRWPQGRSAGPLSSGMPRVRSVSLEQLDLLQGDNVTVEIVE